MNIIQLGMLIHSRKGWPYLADVQGGVVYLHGFNLLLTTDGEYVRAVERLGPAGHIRFSEPVAIWAGDVDYLLARLTTIYHEGCHALRLH